MEVLTGSFPSSQVWVTKIENRSAKDMWTEKGIFFILNGYFLEILPTYSKVKIISYRILNYTKERPNVGRFSDFHPRIQKQ